MNTVWPQLGLPQSLVVDLAERFPQAIIIFHPVYGHWQFYENFGAGWDAQRLFNAIRKHHESGQDLSYRWWDWKHAPRLIDDFGWDPGDWLLEYLGRIDLHRKGGAKTFFLEYNARRDAQRAEKAERQHDLHRGISDDIRRPVRDLMAGDPMAGKRKWSQNIPFEVKQ